MPRGAPISYLRSVSALVLLAVDDSDQKSTFEQVIKKQIEALRKQLDKSGTGPSVLRQDPMPTITREARHSSQVHSSQAPKRDGTAEVELFKQDIQSRAKAAVAHGRSFVA